jgi:hypothetical protein
VCFDNRNFQKFSFLNPSSIGLRTFYLLVNYNSEFFDIYIFYSNFQWHEFIQNTCCKNCMNFIPLHEFFGQSTFKYKFTVQCSSLWKYIHSDIHSQIYHLQWHIQEFFSGGWGFQQIQLRTEGSENGVWGQ